jgi:hypothetical protein
MGSKLIYTSPHAAVTSPLYLSLSLSLSLSQVANIPFSTLFSGVFNLCSSLQSTDQGTCITTSGKIVVIWSKNFRPAGSVVVTTVRSTIRVFWDDAASVCRWFPEFPKKVSPSPSRAQTFITSEILQGVLCEVKKKVICKDEDRLFVCPFVCSAVCLSPNIGDETNWRIFIHSVYEFFRKVFSTLGARFALSVLYGTQNRQRPLLYT